MSKKLLEKIQFFFCFAHVVFILTISSPARSFYIIAREVNVKLKTTYAKQMVQHPEVLVNIANL